MVGGVVSIVTPKENGIEVQVVGTTGCERYERLAVKVKDTPTSRRIKPGDRAWWQGAWVMWTPKEVRESGRKDLKGGVDYDIRIERIGCSYEPKPVRKA